MIVKNEESIIERCLDSLKDFIDAVIISDTGSTDNTIKVIENWCIANHKLGKVVQHEWKNFEHNRNLALQACKDYIEGLKLNGQIDHADIMLIDADDYFVLEDLDLYKKSLETEVDCLWINMKSSGTIYTRPFIFSAEVESKWTGVVHEFCQVYGSHALLNGAFVQVTGDGDRNKNPVKYLNDAIILEKEIKTREITENFDANDIMSARYLFYLAQSYRDFGHTNLAEKLYKKRYEMEIYDEERYISLLEAAKCRIRKNKRDLKCLDYLVKAFNLRPQRLEAIYYIVEYYRIHKLYNMGYWFGKNFLDLKRPREDTLFIEEDIYDYKFYDEVAVCACWSGDTLLFTELYSKILLIEDIPEKTRERVSNDLENFGV